MNPNNSQPGPQVFTPQGQQPTQPTQPAPQPAYQPPAPVTAAPQPAAAGGFNFTSNPFASTSKGLGKALTVNPISTLTVGLLALLSAFGGLIIGMLLLAIVPGALKVIVGLAIFVGLILLIALAFAAMIHVYEKSYEGQTITGREAFKLGQSRLGSFIVVNVLATIFVIVGFILLVIPGLIILARISLMPFVFYRENLSGMAAIKRSFALTKGHTWEMLGALLASSIVVGSSGGLLSFAGSYSSLANRYNELKDAEAAGASTGKVHWLNYFTVAIVILFIIGYAGILAIAGRAGFSEQSKLQNGATGSSSLTQSTLSGDNYCYFANEATYETKCTNADTCKTTAACADLYFKNGSDSSMMNQ